MALNQEPQGRLQGVTEELDPEELADDTGDLHFVPAPCRAPRS